MIRDYLAGIAPPPRAGIATDDEGGAKLFADAGCAACHTPSLPLPVAHVQAYTDLLLHDMGDELGDGATEPGAAPGEWRTAPLWGLSRILASGATLLHNGRAATLDEAIRLHGGEGSRARSRYLALDPPERERLLAFLSNL
jgi:CxxC motif-containing protein (DUF1111 family)